MNRALRMLLKLSLGVPLWVWLACTAAPAMAAGFSSNAKTYRCPGASPVLVIYLETSDGQAFATLYHRRRLVLLSSIPADSGVAYASVDEKTGWRWRARGLEGSLHYKPPGEASEKEQPLLLGCRVVR